MQFSELHETHLTDVGIICDEVLQALKDRFPGKEVGYLMGGKYNTTQGYKLSGTLSRVEVKAVQKLVAKTIKKYHEDNDNEHHKAKEFMEVWEAPKLPLPTDDVLCGLRVAFDEMNDYVESHRTDEPVIAQSFALDCDDLGIVYNLWHAKDFKAAAKYLRELDTIVRDRVPSKEYNKIMEHLPR